MPAHCWVTDWFENASFGNALLFITPLSGVYAAIRLILPVGPDWFLQFIGLTSLATAVYAAGMATVQREEITHAQVSTLFWINVALSAAVMLVLAEYFDFRQKELRRCR